jgi:hypothetical protein
MFNLYLGHPGALIQLRRNNNKNKKSDTPLYAFVMAHYTIYSNMCAMLLHVSALPSHHQVYVH